MQRPRRQYPGGPGRPRAAEVTTTLPRLEQRLTRLRQRYAEPHRAYHNQAHIDALLRGFAAARGCLTNPDAVELAIWYHDAIYDPRATDNEACSAALLRTEWEGLADPAPIEAAAAMIEATASHDLPPGLPDGLRADTAIFLDLDMAILGAAPAEYDAYEAGIGAEYIPVHGAEAYRHGRAGFLRGLLTRSRFFHTAPFHQRLDTPSRANIQRALASLQTPLARPSPAGSAPSP